MARILIVIGQKRGVLIGWKSIDDRCLFFANLDGKTTVSTIEGRSPNRTERQYRLHRRCI